jgi:type IV secretion system protein VirB10
MFVRLAITIVCTLPLALAQDAQLKERPESPAAADTVQVNTGTHILLSMINSVSTRQAQVGDKIYLETAFPIFVNGKTVIPQGSWVTGRVTEVKRPGHVKGKGELQIHFDSLTLRNGVSRNFNSDLGALDASQNQTLNHEQSKVISESGKKTDTVAVVGATTAGTVIGSGIGAASGHAGMGAGVGAGAGAAAGLLGTLLSRGPEAMLPKGSTVEMVLDRPLVYTQEELATETAPSGFGSR